MEICSSVSTLISCIVSEFYDCDERADPIERFITRQRLQQPVGGNLKMALPRALRHQCSRVELFDTNILRAVCPWFVGMANKKSSPSDGTNSTLNEDAQQGS